MSPTFSVKLAYCDADNNALFMFTLPEDIRGNTDYRIKLITPSNTPLLSVKHNWAVFQLEGHTSQSGDRR